MRICIDSCVFINGLTEADPAAVRLLDLQTTAFQVLDPAQFLALWEAGSV